MLGAAFWRGSGKGRDRIILLSNAALFLSSLLLLNIQFMLCLLVGFSFLPQTSATGFSFFFFFPFRFDVSDSYLNKGVCTEIGEDVLYLKVVLFS